MCGERKRAEIVYGEWHESAGACLRIFGLAIMRTFGWRQDYVAR